MKCDANSGWGCTCVGELFADDCVVTEVLDPSAAELLWSIDAQKAGGASGGEELSVHNSVAIPALEIRGHLTFDECSDRLAKEFVVVGEDGSTHALIVGGRDGICWADPQV